jgi:hypothetical protein
MSRVKITSDVFQTTVTLADVTGLAFSMLANTDYEFEFLIPFQTAAVTTGIALALNGPAGTLLLAAHIMVPISASTQVDRHTNAFNTEALGTAIDVINVPRLARIQGIIRNGANAGNLIARYRSEVAGSEVRVKAGALVKYRVI